MRETSPSVLLMAKPSPGAKRLPLSSPPHFLNASSPQRRWVTRLRVIHGLRSAGTARRGQRPGVARRPKGGPPSLCAGGLS